ncbi:related to oxidoreductase related to nitroreductase [Fusarium torulosum]|uniref:Related to oxidoreductase related to nitroreductase n=1 Tax=Fusarium torulosum TaxID=33205 RepID=A0AAE8MAE9_9HYPO|nr:related to oxidoreductase related to nitroreductase [Fusarium torulosum]
MAFKLSADLFLQFVKSRRTYYPLSKDLPISASRIQEIVNEAVLHTPTSFNSQSNRLVVLFGAEHDKLWDITIDTLQHIVPTENWKATSDKLALFKGAAGTILFFDDTSTVNDLQAKFAPFADKFPLWASQSLGMLQFILWTALEVEGLGANLQHYNPLIDEKVAEAWKVPVTWKLNAQLVFGGKTSEATAKQFNPIEDRVKVFGAETDS